MALLGSNGAGKTTLLKAASNLLPAERGAVTRRDDPLPRPDVTRVRTGRARPRRPGAGAGGAALLPLADRRGEPAWPAPSPPAQRRAGTRADLERVFALFPRLAEKRHVSAGLTSGGEQQMTAIGRGLMSRPRLLVLDEPSMGLAPLVVREIFATLRELNAEGLSILVAEQNLVVALAYADRATVIENGRSVLSGPAAELAGATTSRTITSAAPARAPGS